jgi:hypothetical protein
VFHNPTEARRGLYLGDHHQDAADKILDDQPKYAALIAELAALRDSSRSGAHRTATKFQIAILTLEEVQHHPAPSRPLKVCLAPYVPSTTEAMLAPPGGPFD